jgi:hypothetical protein
MATFQPILSNAELPSIGYKQETTDFDIKQDIRLSPKPVAFEMAKDVAAFANSNGGLILVGTSEDKSTNVLRQYEGHSQEHAQQVTDAFEMAVRDRCGPLPFIDPRVLRPSTGGFVAVVNVWPMVAQPVGVRLKGDTNDGFGGDSFVFPLRVGRHTDWIEPEQLPMFMIAEYRKSIIQLESIPEQKRRSVRVVGEDGQQWELKLEKVDVQKHTAVLIGIGSSSSPATRLHIPLEMVRCVWQLKDDDWCILVRGTVSRQRDEFYYNPSPNWQLGR